MRSSLISEATELRMLKALGAIEFQTERGELWALFDNGTVQVGFEETHINSTSPQLTCRTCDVTRLELTGGSSIWLNEKQYEVREPLSDGTGQTILILDDT